MDMLKPKTWPTWARFYVGLGLVLGLIVLNVLTSKTILKPEWTGPLAGIAGAWLLLVNTWNDLNKPSVRPPPPSASSAPNAPSDIPVSITPPATEDESRQRKIPPLPIIFMVHTLSLLALLACLALLSCVRGPNLTGGSIHVTDGGGLQTCLDWARKACPTCPLDAGDTGAPIPTFVDAAAGK